MWYFQPNPQRNLEFKFEPVLKEVDTNEQRDLDNYIKNLPRDKRNTFHQVVCDKWVNTHCVHGDRCQSLHEYDIDKMKKCQFWEKFHECSNKVECIFRHENSDRIGTDCKYYLRGFCRHGDKCQRKHVPLDQVCLNYLAGFCPDGPNCIFSHPKWVEEGTNAAQGTTTAAGTTTTSTEK